MAYVKFSESFGIQDEPGAKLAKSAKETRDCSGSSNFSLGQPEQPFGPAHVEFQERAAIVEFDGKAPREWAEGFARLDCAHPPLDVPARRWRRFIDDCALFLDSGWPARAAGLGWGPMELFGADPKAPFARVDRSGLLWLLDGGALVAIAQDRAVVATRSGVRQTYCRRDALPGESALAWELER